MVKQFSLHSTLAFPWEKEVALSIFRAPMISGNQLTAPATEQERFITATMDVMEQVLFKS